MSPFSFLISPIFVFVFFLRLKDFIFLIFLYKESTFEIFSSFVLFVADTKLDFFHVFSSCLLLVYFLILFIIL